VLKAATNFQFFDEELTDAELVNKSGDEDKSSDLSDNKTGETE
jgi:hypothetical protein